MGIMAPVWSRPTVEVPESTWYPPQSATNNPDAMASMRSGRNLIPMVIFVAWIWAGRVLGRLEPPLPHDRSYLESHDTPKLCPSIQTPFLPWPHPAYAATSSVLRRYAHRSA